MGRCICVHRKLEKSRARRFRIAASLTARQPSHAAHVCIEAAMLPTVHHPLAQAESPNREKVVQSVSQSALRYLVKAAATEPLVSERADFADDWRIDQHVMSLSRAAPQHAIGSVYT